MEKLRRILIVDGHALLTAGLRALLAEEADIELVAEPDQGRGAAPADAKLAPLDVHNAAGLAACAIGRGLGL